MPAKKRREYDMTARSAKAAQTRDRIAEAAAALYIERGLDDLTLDDVAKRAETTVQTILRAFASKEKLIFAALERSADAGTPVRATPPGDLAAGVGALFDLYENIGDYVIGQLADERRHPSLKASLDGGRNGHRAWVRIVFAPQLERRRGSARTQLYNILLVTTDVYVWKLFRRDLALSRSAAESTMRKMLAGVLDAE
jgi:AcrR family transcriptional regulator